MAGLLRNNGSVVGVLALLALLITPTPGVGGARQVHHHVVGGDRGWDDASDLVGWSLETVFRVGDEIWFTYSAAQESIAEVRSREEFESCELSNPIRTYTDGLNRVALDGEGSRYFISGKPDSCKNGLKLHVGVLPQPKAAGEWATTTAGSEPRTAAVAAAGPSIPSGSARIGEPCLIWFGLALLCAMGGFQRA